MTYNWEADAKDGYDEAIRHKRAEWLVANIPGVKRARVIGRCELMQGDCLEIMPHLGRVDAVVTDPPYGLGPASGTIGKNAKHKRDYGVFEDTLDYLLNVSVPAIDLALSIANVIIVTSGSKHAFEYPKPDGMGVFYQPASTGMCVWGRTTSQPILFYGRDPKLGLTIQPMHYVITERPSTKEHPCAKPQRAWEWLCNRATIDGQTILDPFMGSGTTLVACAKLGRKGIGIELDPDYFEIACKRVEEAYRQPDLFVDQPAPAPKQENLDL